MSRLTAKTVLLGVGDGLALGDLPDELLAASVKATIDGVVRAPSALAITSGSPPSITATQELVVPRSIPMTLPIAAGPPPGRANDRSQSSPRRRSPAASAAGLTPSRALGAAADRAAGSPSGTPE